MGLLTTKPSTTKGPKGRCPSLTVLFFAGRECFLPNDVKEHALAMGLTAATARYTEPEPNHWVLKVSFHRGKKKRVKTTMPLRDAALPSYESATAILVGEIRHAYREYKAELELTFVDSEKSTG
jgi:hypothetical protein